MDASNTNSGDIQRFDVIVVGGGHAGCEAATAAARVGATVCLVTHRRDTIGEMSCNPAIGGLGKGHLVREIDALDGVMGRIADLSGIQFRVLNQSKGPAVQGPRAQIDRKLYRNAMQAEIAATPGLTVHEGSVDDLLFDGDRVVGVCLGDGGTLKSGAVVITTGTFLRGVMHLGKKIIPAGRTGEAPANALSARLYEAGFPMGRLKTGTPPRLDGRTIDYSGLQVQHGDETPVPFSRMTREISVPQTPCHITHTNGTTHRVIDENIQQSPLYSGQIESRGPRYCPSIEDKIVRFGDRDSHQIFLEPEGLDDFTVYPNGISTSLPEDVQKAFLVTIKGLEEVRIIQPGYAIEYDFVDPRALTAALETRKWPGLFLAGQINGTTGYEEAGAQGLVAGLNAARATGGQTPVIFSRSDGYLGVMIDDLVTKGITEPYRMFTSRTEYRLTLRADNADLRLTPVGMDAGCVSSDRWIVFEKRRKEVDGAIVLARSLMISPTEANRAGLKVNPDGVKRSVYDLLAYPDIDVDRLKVIWPELAELNADQVRQLEIEALYAVYLDRQTADIAAFKRDENLKFPASLDFDAIPGLSGEVREKLKAVNPETLGQASRIDGVTPAALTLLLAYLKRGNFAKSA